VRPSGVLRPLAGLLFTAEIARRRLTPRDTGPEPAPVDLHSHFSAEEIERGQRFARPQMALALAGSALEGALLIALLRRRPSWLPSRRLAPAAGGAADAAMLATLLSLAPLPLAALARRRAIAVGLVTQTWRAWAVDLVKAAGIQAAFAGAAGAATVELTRRYPRGWWLPVAGGSVLFGAGIAALAPVVLDPLFNDFEPLAEGQTRSDVLSLAGAAGVDVGEVYKVDASRRTTAANAYVTGLGPTKRVVLFDTLLDRYDRDEVRVVVAHELAHVRHRDVPRGLAFAAIVAPAAGRAVQRVSWALSPERGTPGAIPALALAAALVSGPLGLIANRLSRALERRADADSLELSRAPEAFVSFERKIALQNVADLDPPRWVTRLLATHPPTAERIGMALAYPNQAGAPAPAP
jgi:STE24 endopeptidase